MKFETMIYFFKKSDVCGHPEIFLPWQRDVMTSPLYHVNYGSISFCITV